MKLIILLAFLCSVINYSNGYFITVDAHAEECFFDRLNQGTKMGLTFEIAEGGFLDIDVTIVGPSGQSIYNGEREGNGKYTFAANEAGDYTYCFSNKKSTMTPKVVMFTVDINEPTKPDEHLPEVEGGDNSAKLDDMIKDLSTAMWEVKNEQNYMQVRDRNHRAINESTNFRVVLWTVFEASVLFCMTLGQVFYLKRFFEVRRVV